MSKGCVTTWNEKIFANVIGIKMVGEVCEYEADIYVDKSKSYNGITGVLQTGRLHESKGRIVIFVILLLIWFVIK